METFSYHRPANVADAVRALGAASDGRALAGGQTLLASMKLGLAAPSDLVDLGGVSELHGIRTEGDKLVIGAMTRHAEVANSAEVRAAIPALADLAEGIGDRQVRNAGTLGGSLANADPAADYPAAVLGLGAEIRTDRRTIAADDFFKGLFETALQPGELIVAVAFPKPQRAAYIKFVQPASRFALVGVFVAQTAGGVRVAVTGAGPCAFRAGALESALSARFSPDACNGITIAPDGLNTDLHGSAAYRACLIPVIVRRVVASLG
jgi:carbon-monoxide dehydrogenase medium subunit